MSFTIIALDLEGTLVSNAMSVFPRDGLFDFLEFCKGNFERVAIMTAVSEERTRPILELLAKEKSAPNWFAGIEIVDWDRKSGIKNLCFVDAENINQVLLVDDIEAYIHPGQKEQWVAIKPFVHPYEPDGELEKLKNILSNMLN